MKKFNGEIDYYKVLGIEKDCSDAELKKAYRKRALETHPDVNKDKSGETFKRVNEAYEVLSNPDIRSRYDSIRDLGYNNSPKSGQSKSPFEGFNNFYWDIFGENWEARAPTPEEERADYERKERKEKEYAEKEAGYRARRERRVNQLWREGVNKIIPYVLKFPDLKLNFYGENWFKENFARMYERDGSLFNEDVGIFNLFMNQTGETDGKDLYKILMETRGGDFAFCESRISLKTNNLSGLELLISKKVPTKLRGGELLYCGPTTIQFAIHSAISNFQAPTNLPYNEDKSEESSLMQHCQFLAHLSNSIKKEDYEIKFSDRLPKKHEFTEKHKDCGYNHFGLWIDSLRLGEDIAIQDGEVINLVNGLRRIKRKEPKKLR